MKFNLKYYIRTLSFWLNLIPQYEYMFRVYPRDFVTKWSRDQEPHFGGFGRAGWMIDAVNFYNEDNRELCLICFRRRL